MKKSIILSVALASTCEACAPSSGSVQVIGKSSTALNGLFDGFKTGGSGNSKESLDEQWEAQQRMLKLRKGSTEEKSKYFEAIEKRRIEASKKQKDMWSWQTKSYGKGEDPINEWKKKRASGDISDLEDQYGDPKKVGGIPIPGASFGVGGEFGVGGMCYLIVVGRSTGMQDIPLLRDQLSPVDLTCFIEIWIKVLSHTS